MACFLVSAAEALVVTAAAQAVKHHEEKTREELEKTAGANCAVNPYPWSRRLMLLAYLLWGGVVLLAFEHVWHGEVVPWFPFLTAMYDPGDTAEMLHEMGTVGVTMACLITAVWGIIMGVASSILKRPEAASASGRA
ncbi:MAG: hypothetical protein ACOX68_06045 [Candidatus Limivicinus sp.]|jgi:hypothetical protein